MLNFRLCILFAIFWAGQALAAPKAEPLNIMIDHVNGNNTITHLLSEISRAKGITLKHVPERTTMSAQVVRARSNQELIVTINLELTDDSFIKANIVIVTNSLTLKAPRNKPCHHDVKGELIPNQSEHFTAENVKGWGLEYVLTSTMLSIVHSQIIGGVTPTLVTALVSDFLRHGGIEVNGVTVTLKDHYGCTLENYPTPTPEPSEL